MMTPAGDFRFCATCISYRNFKYYSVETKRGAGIFNPGQRLQILSSGKPIHIWANSYAHFPLETVSLLTITLPDLSFFATIALDGVPYTDLCKGSRII